MPQATPAAVADEAVREDAKPTRKKNPRYDVYRVDESGYLRLLFADVAAPTRQAAIEKQDNPWGTFATVRAGELKVQTREKAVREEAVWK